MEWAKLFNPVGDFIKALANLSWPVLSFVVVLIFRKEITSLLARTRKAKILGQEFEIDPEVQEFHQTVTEVEQEIAEEATMEPTPEEPVTSKLGIDLDKDVERILDTARSSLDLAIIELSHYLESALREAAGVHGFVDSETRKVMTGPSALSMLVKYRRLPKQTEKSLDMFRALRNRIVHGREWIDERDALRVLDTGVSLLKSIRSVPRDRRVVYHPGLDVFLDSQCTEIREDVKGVMLETATPDQRTIKSIFPTKLWDYYEKGKEVTWEWDLSEVWNRTWYVDPDSGERKKAWDSAGLFVGRHLEDL